MKKFAFLRLTIILLLFGCSSNRMIQQDTTDDFNIFAQGKNAELLLRGGIVLIKAQNMSIVGDSTVWYEMDRRQSCHTSQVNYAKFTSRGLGFAKGATIGLIGGAIIGALTFQKPDPEEINLGPDSASDNAMVGGVVGIVIGSIVGGVAGDRVVYFFGSREK